MVTKPTYAELENRIKDLEDQCKRYEKTEAELVRNTGFTESLLNAIPTPIFFKDAKGRYLGCNPAFSDIMGVKVQDIRGKTVHELWPSEHAEVYHQKDLELMQNPTNQVYEFEIKDKDGSIRPVIYYKNAFFDEHDKVAGLIGGFVDISERKKMEEALKEAYEIIKESPAVAFLWKNEEGWPVDYVSENVVSLLGYTAEEIMSGKVSYVDVVHPEDLERVGEEVETFSSEEGRERFDHIPYRVIAKDGSVKWVRDSTSIRRDQDGGVSHYHGIVEDRTETIEAEQALRGSEVLFRTLVENSQAGIFLVDENYCFAYANDELSNILGYSPEEVNGLDFRAVLDEESRKFVADRYVRRQKGEDVPSRYGIGIIRKDGKKRRLEMVATAIANPDGTVQTMGQVLDITDRKKAEKSLRDSEERFRELAENIREVFWLFDWEKQEVLYVSPAYEEVWGRSMEDLHERYQEWGNSIHPDDAQYAEASFNKILETGGGENREYRIIRPDGAVRWILDRGFAIRGKDGEVRRIAGIAEDITDRKNVEEELGKYRQQLEEIVKERTRELEMAQEELLKNERLAVLGQLTATVSHELRNPLGVVRSSAFYLQQKNKEQDPKIIKHINRIEEQVEICDSIVGDLLEYTRGRHSQMVVGEITPWIEQVLDDLPKEIDIQINIALEDNLPRIQFDKEKVRRVVVNLMDNAFQAITERKRVAKDDIFEPNIEVTMQAIDQDIMIRVKDNGIGMDPETMDRAFEPLFTTRARGTGLGLANVKKIIEEHNGTIWLESKPNKGTAVIITIRAQTED